VYWAYFSGTGKATTSSVISLDGSKIAYIENPASGAAILRIIEWKSGQGTPAAAATPQVEFNNAQVGAAGNKAWSSCTAGESCMISVPFQNGDQDTTSSSFYVYFGTYGDTIFVGDNNGKLHQFTGVFNGTPAEVTTNWPVSVSANALTSAVYDAGTSGNIFVADRGATGGFLYAVSPSTHAKVLTTSKLTYASGTVGIVDGPLVDSNAQMVYIFVGAMPTPPQPWAANQAKSPQTMGAAVCSSFRPALRAPVPAPAIRPARRHGQRIPFVAKRRCSVPGR